MTVELLVTIEPPPPSEEAPEPRAAPPEASEPREPTRANPRDARLAALAPSRPSEGPPAAPSEPAPPRSAESTWSPSWTLPQGIDLGLDGGIAWRTALHPDSVDPGGRPGGAPEDPGQMRAALDAHDRELGLGSGGPVVRAVHEVARSLSAIRDGAATLEVTTDASGRVLSVHAFEATSDDALWNEWAKSLAAELEGHALPVPRGARGLVITVRVEAAVRSASGAKAGRPVSPMANTEGAGLGFDVTDIGSRARSVVHARVVGERRL